MVKLTIVDLVTIATISLSAAVAWITYVTSWRESKKSHISKIKLKILELREELNHIKAWAESDYDDDSDVPENWNNPFWRVLDFPSKNLETFIHLFDEKDIGKTFSNVLVKLVASISYFRSMLDEHRKFVESGMKAYSHYNEHLSQNIFHAPQEWRTQLYNLNKKIHVEGIGNSKTENGLHISWKNASDELGNVITDINIKDPRTFWIGHILSVILGIIGMSFLIVLVIKLIVLFK